MIRVGVDVGLDQPFYVQYVRFIGNAVQGQFGTSYRLGTKVTSIMAERLPEQRRHRCTDCPARELVLQDLGQEQKSSGGS